MHKAAWVATAAALLTCGEDVGALSLLVVCLTVAGVTPCLRVCPVNASAMSPRKGGRCDQLGEEACCMMAASAPWSAAVGAIGAREAVGECPAVCVFRPDGSLKRDDGELTAARRPNENMLRAAARWEQVSVEPSR